MRTRTVLFPLLACGLGACAALDATAGPRFTAPAALAAVAVLAVLVPPWRLPPAWPAGVAAAVSLAVTAGFPGGPGTDRAAVWWVVETAAFWTLSTLLARRAPARAGAPAAVLVLAAVAVLPVRLGTRMTPPAQAAELAVLCLLSAIGAACAGLYLRGLDRRRERAVAEERRAQRLALARDQHDFVAHDVSGIVVQAQAARLVGESDPAAALAALARIEQAGVAALGVLDRTVRVLHDEDDAHAGAPEGLDELADLVRRFSDGAPAAVDLDVAPGLAPPREIAAMAHRVVAEALTNVRRHAPGATGVRVAVSWAGDALIVDVVNDLPGSAAAGPFGIRDGGRGLAGLAACAEALGGRLDAGPDGAGGRRLSAVLPM